MRITIKVIDFNPNEIWDDVFDLNYTFCKNKDSYTFLKGDDNLNELLLNLKQELSLKNKTILIIKN